MSATDPCVNAGCGHPRGTHYARTTEGLGCMVARCACSSFADGVTVGRITDESRPGDCPVCRGAGATPAGKCERCQGTGRALPELLVSALRQAAEL